MPRKKAIDGPTQQIRLRVPGDLQKRIESAAAESGVSVNKEILKRLNRSFGPQWRSFNDPKVYAIVDLIAEVVHHAGRLTGDWAPGPWYDQPYAFHQVLEAISVALRSIAPDGKPDDFPPTLSRSSDRALLMGMGKLAAESVVGLVDLGHERVVGTGLSKEERELGARLRTGLGHIAERIPNSASLEKTSKQVRGK
ncbi:toxin-antitoxin system HicB family antitoxin [Bradyrhizobium erythrophlei]|uniref:HicB family protein n=1 Tax=Bradyrhizobium erythrophlei TaxID=1437360 RepID=A0A1M7UUU9_9BRAD|nr:toxin-antitoxin system HicB family antitoxin [Bradyrhizobium erythrophlei]SHN86739.1 HicB family protein [Bradyrhizobium erythrophlei]